MAGVHEALIAEGPKIADDMFTCSMSNSEVRGCKLFFCCLHVLGIDFLERRFSLLVVRLVLILK